MDLNKLTVAEAKEGLKEKKFSVTELTKACLERIKRVDSKIKALVTVSEDKALARAKEFDRHEGKNLPLMGIPVTVKDVLSTKDLQTTASDKILEGYLPIYDASVVEKIKEAGAIIVAKTNCDPFAFGASTENSAFGPTKNPWDLERVPGGSSGGSAASIAADEAIFSLGTDTGGSIRQPASFCNIVGLKPSYGSDSRFGLMAMASSFDCPGPMSKTVEDCEEIYRLIRGKDFSDATSIAVIHQKENHDKLKIGLPKEYFSSGVNLEVREAVQKAAQEFEKNGFSIEEISLPHTDYVVAIYYILVPSEISSNMARYDGIRFGKERKCFSDEVKRRIMIGTYALSAGYYDAFYLKASKARSLIMSDFQEAFKKVDFLLAPVSPNPPFKLGEKSKDPLQMYLEDILTAGINLAGIPSLALPCGFSKEKLPIGMQLIGPLFSEERLLATGKIYQNFTDWHKRKPNLN